MWVANRTRRRTKEPQKQGHGPAGSTYTPVPFRSSTPERTPSRNAVKSWVRTSPTTNGSIKPCRSARSWITVQCSGSPASRENRDRGVERIHQEAERSGAMTARRERRPSPDRPRRTAAPRATSTISSTPSASNRGRVRSPAPGVPDNVSARHASHVSASIAPPGNRARPRSNAASRRGLVLAERASRAPPRDGTSPGPARPPRTPGGGVHAARVVLRRRRATPRSIRRRRAAISRSNRGPPLPPTQTGIAAVHRTGSTWRRGA